LLPLLPLRDRDRDRDLLRLLFLLPLHREWLRRAFLFLERRVLLAGRQSIASCRASSLVRTRAGFFLCLRDTRRDLDRRDLERAMGSGCGWVVTALGLTIVWLT
jgi:hypothetical protein